jgi:hypothetical protein
MADTDLAQLDKAIERVARAVEILRTDFDELKKNQPDFEALEQRQRELQKIAAKLSTVVFGSTEYGIPGVKEIRDTIEDIRDAENNRQARLDGMLVSLRWLGFSSLTTLLTIIATIVSLYMWLSG